MEDKQFLKQIGLKLKVQRMLSGLKMEEVSKKCGITAGTLCNIELGKRDFHIINLKKIVEVYNIDIKDVF